MERVIIGVDPHKLSATIEVVDAQERFLGAGRFGTDGAGYAAMLRYVKAWPNRTWAVEGANGVGRPLAQRLLETCEHVVDVPAKLAARVRLFDTGHNRKTDARDAHSIAVVALRTEGLRVLQVDGELEALRMLVERREALTRRRVQSVNRLQASGRAASGAGEEGHHHRSGKEDARLGATQGYRRQDPPPARGRRTHRTGQHRRQDQEVHRRAQDDGPCPRLAPDGPARGRPGRGGPHTGTSDQPLPGPAPTTLPPPTPARKSQTPKVLQTAP
jgi:transposase